MEKEINMEFSKNEEKCLVEALCAAISTRSREEIKVNYTGPSIAVVAWMEILIKLDPCLSSWVRDIKTHYEKKWIIG